MFTIIYIFKIICKDPGDVGSTNDMKNNEGTFRSSCNFLTDKHYARYVFRFRTEHNGWDTWSCVMVKLAYITSVREGEQLKREYIISLIATLYVRILGLIMREYYQISK